MSFGATAPKPFSFGNLAPPVSQSQSTPFGQTQSTPFGQSLQNNTTFKLSTQPTQPTQPQQTGFGGYGGTLQQPQNSFFGQSTQQQNQPQQQQNSVFGQSTQQQNLPQQQSNFFGQSAQQQNQPQQLQPLPGESLQYGKSRLGQSQNVQTPLWEEGRGLGVFRSIPIQLKNIRDKWNPDDPSSPFRTYLYQHVEKEEDTVKYQPGPEDDEKKWEEAVSRRPGPHYVPALQKGFIGLANRAKLQREWIAYAQIRLREINDSLDVQLDNHRQNYATRLAECRRRHELASRRTLALAVKIQILRNRGYVMDNAEEELKAKLAKLEREVLDPGLSAREQEVWARMLEIRERGKRLKSEMEKVAPAAKTDDPILDEETVKKAKKALEDYDSQLRHLQQELLSVQQEFDILEKTSHTERNGTTSRRW